MMRKRAYLLLNCLLFVVCLMPLSILDVYADEIVHVSTWEEFDKAVTNMTSNVTIHLDNDIEAPAFVYQTVYTIQSDYSILIQSNNQSKIVMPDGYNLAFEAYTKVDGVNFEAKSVRFNKSGEIYRSEINATLAAISDSTVDIYSGKFSAVNNNGGIVNLKPEDNINIDMLTIAASGTINLQEQVDHPISEVTLAEKDISLTNGSYKWDSNGTRIRLGVFSVVVGNGQTGSKINYTASFGSPSVTTIEPTSEQPFTVPVILTSDAELSGAQLSLQCNPEVAKITGVTLAEGLTANGENSIAADGGSALISFFDNQQSAKDGLTVATVSMQPVAEGISSLSMTEGTAAMSGRTLEYPVTVPESPVTVEVKSQDTMATSTYVSTTEGVVTLLKYTPGTAPAEGKVPAYDGTAMMKGPDGSWLYLVKGEPDKAKIGLADGTAASVAHPQKGETEGTPADLNNTDGRVNIVDAQIAYDLATGRYMEIAPELTDTTIDLLHWLRADVNGDETVTAEDARAIQAFIHTQEWFKESAA